MIRTFCKLVGVLGLAVTGCSSDALQAASGGAPGQPSDTGGSPAAGGAAAAGSPGTSVGTAPRAVYPEGPYGRGVGAVIANLSFLGWRDPAKAGYDPTKLERISLSDFYNPNGTTNDVHVIMLNASAVWCSVCKAEYKHMRDSSVYSTYRPKGVEILGVIFEDAKYNPAKPTDLVVWGSNDGFSVPFPLVVDPGFKVGVYFDSDATPMNMLIDATTMRIIDVTMGYDSRTPEKYWQYIDSLL
ncbi:MAG TPA: redoxin domain-containing protein [Polyangiaceae bacterium]|nr:redoxin domain-containing protein [Polyangiaceae bacterium]